MYRYLPFVLLLCLCLFAKACHGERDDESLTEGPGAASEEGAENGSGNAVSQPGASLDPARAAIISGAANHPDAGPRLDRVDGPFPSETLPAIELRGAVGTVGGVDFVRVAHNPDGNVANIDVQSDVYGFAVPNVADQTILVRFAGRAPKQFSLTVVTVGYQHEGTTQPIDITGLDKASDPSPLRVAFFDGAATWLETRGTVRWRTEPFYAFASARARVISQGGVFPESDAERPWRSSRTEMGELMSLYTGMTSVEEALQADRGLLFRGTLNAEEMVPIGEIAGVDMPTHPWESMIAARGGTDAVVIEPLAHSIPQDMIYVHFHDLRDLVGIAGEFDGWVSPVSQALEANAGQSFMFDRYQEQLAIDRSGLAETLGHLAANGVAIVASDPFLREGGDVSIVFDVKSETLLDTALAKYEGAITARHSDARVQTIRVAGHDVRLLATPDKTVFQHRLKLGNLLIVSNSAKAIESLIDVHEQRSPALAASGDFRYLRTLYPFDAEGEDGFVFIGDAMVGDAINPKARILQARRMAARADLLAINHAALLYGWLEGKAPTTIDEVVELGLLDARELQHADGSAIAWTREGGARSDRWGSVANMTPLIEMDLRTATRAEVDAYGRWRDTYQSNWRGFIDPIGIRFVRDDTGSITVDGRMLPLIERSEYDDLIEMAGTGTSLRAPLDGAVVWTMAVGDDSELRRELNQIGGYFGGIKFDWMGDWVAFVVADRSGLWDMALASESILEARDRGAGDDEMWEALARLPVVLAVHVDQPMGLAAFLNGAKMVANAAPDMVRWDIAGSYRDVSIVSITEQEGLRRVQPESALAIHYATVGDILLLSFDRTTLEVQIDALLDNRDAVWRVDGSQEPMQVDLFVEFAGQYFPPTMLGGMEQDLLTAHAKTEVAYVAMARGMADAWPEDTEAQQALALQTLGFAPTSVHGGQLSMANGLVVDTVYGSSAARVLPPVPVVGSPLTEAVARYRSMNAAMSFEQFEDDKGGVHHGLHVRLEVQSR